MVDQFIRVPVTAIVEKLPVRKLNLAGVLRLRDSIRARGFLASYPLVVIGLGNDTYKLVNGNHRLAAAIEENITEVPVLVFSDMKMAEAFRMAFQSNQANEAYVKNTLVTYAEFIWNRVADGMTQSEIGEILGWRRESVKNYIALQKISHCGWLVIGTTFEEINEKDPDDAVPPSGTVVPFTEYLLRAILDLRSCQQLELIQRLADGVINKGKFKALAEAYSARNAMKRHAIQTLGDVGYTLLKKACVEIAKGSYDDEYEHKKSDGPRLVKLVQSIRDEWQEKHSTQLLQGDFYDLVKTVGDESVDLIITDPPYNVSSKRTFILEGRSNISQDFGEWDKHDHTDFIALFAAWGKEYSRLLRDGGSGYIFTSDSYISHLREALEDAGLTVKATLVWHKTNPGTQVVKTNFRSSVEYILFFTKGEKHTFNWLGENEMHNFIESPICAGNERLTSAKKETLHPTQKPERVIAHLMEISSVKGDLVFDGFMGVGTTAKVARDLGRKFIGIEQDQTYFEAAQWRTTQTAERRAS